MVKTYGWGFTLKILLAIPYNSFKKKIKDVLRKTANALFDIPYYLREDVRIPEILHLKTLRDYSKLTPISRVELHVSHACNLACESCSHYSNHHFKGNITLEEADEWMSLWNKKVAPSQIHLMGGEPTIHPQLLDIIRLTRKKWKYTKIFLVTNGFFLHRHPDLPKVLKEVGNARLVISIHHSSDAYMEKITPNLTLAKEWEKKYNLDVKIRPSVTHWTRRYKGYGSGIQPFEDNHPRASWENCPARRIQLFEGKLWKCAPLAYLPMMDKKFKLSEKWQPYLQYKPLSPDCSKEELLAFIKQEEIPQCAMCAAKPEYFELPNPLDRDLGKAGANNQQKSSLYGEGN